MCKQLLPLFFAFITTLGLAQRPNSALRLPVMPDMPEWAQQIYRDDIEVNVFQLDEAFLPWKIAYESLKIEVTKAGTAATEAQKAELQALKKYYKYYTRWRNSVQPFVQPDGSLLFDAALLPEIGKKNEPLSQAKSSTTWTLLGPLRTYQTANENPNQELKPYQANIFTIAVAPNDANTLLYGTATGLVGKSTDKGQTWTTVGTNYFVGPNMRGAAIHPSNTSIFYIGDDTGVHTSTNGGTTWSQALTVIGVSKFPNELYFEMEYSEQKWDPRYANTYYIGNGNKFWKTIDNGASFTALFIHADANAKVQHIEVSRSDPNTIYFTVQLGSNGELWKSTNGGTNWTLCANPSGPTAGQRRVSNITLSGTDAQTLWWAFRDAPNGNKIFKSIDGGATWANQTTAALNNSSIADIVHQLGTNGGVYLCANNVGTAMPPWAIGHFTTPACPLRCTASPA